MAAHASTGCRSPLTAVRLEDLRLDDLIAGAADDQIEVIVGRIMAEQVHICGENEKEECN